MIDANNLKDVLHIPSQPEETNNNADKKQEVIPEDLQIPNRIGASPLELSIIEGILLNKTPAQVASEVGLPSSSVKAFLARKEVQEYLAELRDALNVQNQLIIQDTLGKMLQARIANMEEEGGDFAELSEKDTLDIIKAFADITNAIEKNKKAENEQDIFVQIYNKVM